jgi:septal ring factor EnvC (AmiA/AmiB activator)
MKRRLYIVILLCCLVPAASFAQSSKKNSKTPSKTTARKREQPLPVPASLYSVEELNSQRKKALEDIELTSRLLDETSADAKNSLNRLNLLTQQLISRRRVLLLLGQEMSAIDANIKTMIEEIDILDKDLVKTKENYARSMQNQQREHRTVQYKMLLILSAENLSQSYRRMRYLREYSDWQKTEAGRIVAKQTEITLRKAELEKSRNDKQELLAQREQENKKLEEEEHTQQKEVRELNKRKTDLQRQLQQKQKEADALDRQIELLITEDIRDSENKAPATAPAGKTSKSTAASREPAASGTTRPAAAPSRNYRMTESELSLAKDFAGNKGRLPYPLIGKCTIISSFGEHQHQELSHVRTNNNGVDILTTSGSDALAIFNGVVTRVFVMPGYNNNVIIRHGDYLTVYSNLSQVYVKAGDLVVTRQPLGKVFTDTEKGHATILHFQIWKERTKLNPASWIRK